MPVLYISLNIDSEELLGLNRGVLVVLYNFIHIVHLVASYLYNCNKWFGELDKIKINGKTFVFAVQQV